MAKPTSAGILSYRLVDSKLQVLLVHPGGPYWASKDSGVWSIPKGLVEEGEDILTAAKREFEEETNFELKGDPIGLGTVVQKSGKTVHAWAVPGNYDTDLIQSNLIEIEWPPKSGKKMEIPEVNKAAYFEVSDALVKLNPAQAEFVRRLAALLSP